MAYNFYPNPRDDPMNADIPNVNKPATIIGVTVTMLTLGIMAMTLRLWVRIRDRLWGCDDAFVLFAGLSSVVGDSMVCLMPKDGLGLHFWTLDYVHLNSYFKHIYSTNVVYCASSTFIKLAILFQYLRLFSESASSTTSTQYRIARLMPLSHRRQHNVGTHFLPPFHLFMRPDREELEHLRARQVYRLGQ